MIGDTEAGTGLATAARLGADFIETDISRWDHAERIVAEAVARHGTLDIMVQNAGIFPWQLIEKTAPDEWDRVMAVNLRGAFLAARAALPPMKARGRAAGCSSPRRSPVRG